MSPTRCWRSRPRRRRPQTGRRTCETACHSLFVVHAVHLKPAFRWRAILLTLSATSASTRLGQTRRKRCIPDASASGDTVSRHDPGSPANKPTTTIRSSGRRWCFHTWTDRMPRSQKADVTEPATHNLDGAGGCGSNSVQLTRADESERRDSAHPTSSNMETDMASANVTLQSSDAVARAMQALIETSSESEAKFVVGWGQ